MSEFHHKLVFTFPGQGSFSPQLLRNLYLSQRPLRRLFYSVDEAAGDVLGAPFLPVVFADDAGRQQGLLAEHPDLDQLGIYLANYATAQLWLQRGLRPDLLLGHSFGEMAAFAVAGVYSFEQGARIVCQRVLSLREAANSGRMAAVSAPRVQVEAVLKGFAKTSSVSAVNHSKQTVVSGPEQELEELRDRLAREAVSVTLLKSRYPFHSKLLAGASRTFEIALMAYRFEKPCYPVFVGTEHGLIDSRMDLATAMARQLVTPLDFEGAASRFFGEGYTHFLECGAGDIVTKIIGTVLKSKKAHREWATFPASDEVDVRLSAIQDEISSEQPKDSVVERQPFATSEQPAPAADSQPRPVVHPEPSANEPIAIVDMGCVLPGGADDPETFWKNVRAGVSGIVDLTEIDPNARQDFVAGSVEGGEPQIIADKTYTLLNGSITKITYDPDLLRERYTEPEFDLLTKGQKILALAVAQAYRPETSETDPARLQCILGATADGWAELDEAHLKSSAAEALSTLNGDAAAKKTFAEVLSQALPGGSRKPESLTQHTLCAAVAENFLGVGSDSTYIVDAACSSSLYSLGLGAMALRTGEADLVYAGGVFAPGPVNNSLFAQFRGLTSTSSRPLDAKADGVVFGDGAGVLALKRLTDAIDDGDRVLGVIRAEGFSSDGKTPSINVPRSKGQIMALKRAYAQASLDPASVQYVEAHATATPVGDAVEFEAICEALPPCEGRTRLLGSVKSLIGHTGWTSGVASVIKICKALEHRVVPKQFNYASPNPEINLDGSGFSIPLEETSWPENSTGVPRRAGINGFGFGGTNAHFVVEEYIEPYHRALAERFRAKTPALPEVVIVGAEGLFPSSQHQFERGSLRMPKKRLVLPDVAENMDATQFLAVMVTEKVVNSLPAAALDGDLRIGVTLGLESKTERGVRASERIFLDRLSRIVRAAGGSEQWLEKLRSAITARGIPSGPYTLPGLMPNVAASRITHTFNWRGPNITLDRGKGSLVQALDAAVKFVRAGDCDIVLAVGVNAWAGHDDSAHEGATLIALATADTARKHKLPILARLRFNGSSPEAVQVALNAGTGSSRGATGASELLDAIGQVSRKSNAATLTWNGKPLMTMVPANGTAKLAPARKVEHSNESLGSHAYVQGTPITNYTPTLVEAPELQARGSVKGRSYLFLTDQPDAWHYFKEDPLLRDLTFAVVTPQGVKIPGAHVVDVSTEDTLRESLGRLGHITFDTIVALKELSRSADDDLLTTEFTDTRPLLDLLFGICRHRYEEISERRCGVATICLGSLRDDELDPYTGLFGGFIKSLAREQPHAACKALATDETQLVNALGQAVSEIEANDDMPEVAYRMGRRLRTALTQSQPLHSNGTPWIEKDSVVLATGGGRGVTAVLAEYLLQAYGCTVIALGRTDPDFVPASLRELDEEAFTAYESQFYRDQLKTDRSKKIPELKKLYERYQASHELCRVIQRCKSLPGRFEYIRCDINDPAAINNLADDVLARHGRLDMVMHGAGVQVSKFLPRKDLADFQRVVTTKMASLGHLYRACLERGIHETVKFHLLTSAFSYLGNDGQPDYGAANEAMNRLAQRLNLRKPQSYWSSLAWLGWAGIGMTRRTEYAALAASRRLRGINREEGQQIFADAMAGPPASAINVLLADGEVKFYSPKFSEAATPAGAVPETRVPQDGMVEWPVSPDTMPFLREHVVRGIPTLPGSFIIVMAADAAHQLLPDLKIVQFERTRFLRFVRAHEGRLTKVRAISNVTGRDKDETVVRVRIVLDFVHKSGRVLENDLLHTEIYVRMAPTVRESTEVFNFSANGTPAVRLEDPYVMESSPVRLNGGFKAIGKILVDDKTRRADYKLRGDASYGSNFDYLIPNIIMVDAFWRFGTVRVNENGNLAVYVPERCDAMKVFLTTRISVPACCVAQSPSAGPIRGPRATNSTWAPSKPTTQVAVCCCVWKAAFAATSETSRLIKLASLYSVAMLDRREVRLGEWMSALSRRERNEVASYPHSMRRARTIASRVLTKYLLACPDSHELRRVCHDQLEAARNSEWTSVELLSGNARMRAAPNLFRAGRVLSSVSASSSHSGPLTASCISRDRVGLNLERIEHRRPEFYSQTFSPDEQAWSARMEAGAAIGKEVAYTFLWSVKEAFLKAAGRRNLSVWSFPRWSVQFDRPVEDVLRAGGRQKLLSVSGIVRALTSRVQ